MSESTTVRLSGDMGIQAVAQQCETLRAVLAGAPGDVILDLSQVQAWDSAGVQLLVAAHRTLSERGHALQVTDAGPATVEVLSALGLDALLLGARMPVPNSETREPR